MLVFALALRWYGRYYTRPNSNWMPRSCNIAVVVVVVVVVVSQGAIHVLLRTCVKMMPERVSM